jgi:deoxyribodipyrimidine photo-lyase
MMPVRRPSVGAAGANGVVMSVARRPALLWFRRDLRLHDHPALRAAVEAGDPVLPLYVLDPALLRGRFASPTRAWFLLGGLDSLRASLRDLGSDLVVRVGDPRQVVPALARERGAGDVFVSRDHAPYGRARDRAVADALAVDGVRWHARRGVLVHEPDELATAAGTPFSVYSPFRRAWEALERRPVLPAPSGMPALPGIEPGVIPSLVALGLDDGERPDPQALPRPSEAAARDRLARWLARGVEGYARTRDRLDDEDGTSRLSADLHLGLLSPLEVVAGVTDEGSGGRTYRNEIVWREFYAHVLFHRPALLREAFRPEFEAISWSGDDAAVDAWRAGRTGYPVVDAGMRQLAATGWMHNRARMISASFLTKHLLTDWRVGEAWFMRRLVDGDVASNNGGWQWSASTGTDPQPYFRIFNPILQGRRHDPDGAYIRRWVPELAAVPTARIHAPWEMTPAEQADAGCRIGIDYPAPIVDHGEARARALAVYEAARRTS